MSEAAFESIVNHCQSDISPCDKKHADLHLKWLESYLREKTGHTSFPDWLSSFRLNRNGFPLNRTLLQTVFKMHLHNIPTDNVHRKVVSYVDDIKITLRPQHQHRLSTSAHGYPEHCKNFCSSSLRPRASLCFSLS